MTQTTHWDDCWKSGPEHYECAVARADTMEKERNLYIDYTSELLIAKEQAEAEVERLRADAEWLRESLLAYGRHLDHCGDSDAYNNAALESCGCGLGGILDHILAARGES